MRVALVQCPPWGSLPPLGTASLKAYVEPHGHPVRCFDLNIDYCHERELELLDVAGSVYARPDPSSSGAWEEWSFEFDGEVTFTGSLQDRPLPVDRWVAEVLDWSPELVGFSVQSTNLGVTLQVANQIKRTDPSIRIVFGGPNVAEAQQGAMALLTGIPDVVVEGEGEATLLELIEAYDSGRDVTELQGIGVLLDGEPTWTPRRPLLGDLGALPFPDFSDVDWSRYPNPYEIPIMASRGCVLNCAFCYETVYWKRFRTQPAQRVVDEIVHQLANHPLRAEVEAGRAQFGLSFADSLVNGHLGGLRRMAELIAERDLGIYWNGQATVNTKMDDAYFGVLSASGCTGLSFGLESGSQHVLESMGKRFQIDEATDFFERVHRSGIDLYVNIMVGFPTETRADFIETLRFLTSIRRMVAMVNNVGATAVVGGSRIQEDPEQFGVTPVHLRGWDEGTDFSWTSKAAGTERERDRRVKILHAWMTLMRIPHQRIGPARRWARLPWRQTDRLARPRPRTMPVDLRANRIAELTALAGSEPLLLATAEERVHEVLSTPNWASSLQVETWNGVALVDIQALVTPLFGGDVKVAHSRSEQGVAEARVEPVHPSGAGPAALLAAHFPASDGEKVQVLALFCVPAEVHAS